MIDYVQTGRKKRVQHQDNNDTNESDGNCGRSTRQHDNDQENVSPTKKKKRNTGIYLQLKLIAFHLFK